MPILTSMVLIIVTHKWFSNDWYQTRIHRCISSYMPLPNTPLWQHCCTVQWRDGIIRHSTKTQFRTLKIFWSFLLIYCISVNSFRVNYSFLKVKNVEIFYFHIVSALWQFYYFLNWIVAAETIEGGKLFKGGNYSRKYGRSVFTKLDSPRIRCAHFKMVRH